MVHQRTAVQNISLTSVWREYCLRLWRFCQPLLISLGAFGLSLAIWYGLDELESEARIAFILFGLAIIGWVFTQINDTYIALAAALMLVLTGISESNDFYTTLGDPMIWLLFAAFIIAAGVTEAGLSHRLTLAIATRARSVSHLFYLLTGVIMVTAFIIPATSGRAVLMVPVFMALSKAIDNPRLTRALALLFPTTILLSAVASLIGAGAHLVTTEFIWHMSGERISFARWMLLGTPLALISCFLSTWTILHLFLNRHERRQPLQLSAASFNQTPASRLGVRELYVLAVVIGAVLLWATEPLHGVNNTLVAILGAVAVTAPKIGIISFKAAVKGVNWSMLLFMAATLELGAALTKTGGAAWLIERIFNNVQDELLSSAWLVAGLVILVSLLAHLLITSRTARSSVLVPLVILLGAALGYNPVALAFISTAAAGFCLTLPVSAKPVAMFSQLEEKTYSPTDLLRLSAVLLPLHLAILLAFAMFIWPALGLNLITQPSPQPATPPAWHIGAPLAWLWAEVESRLQPAPDAGFRRQGDTISLPGSHPAAASPEPAAGPTAAPGPAPIVDILRLPVTNPQDLKHR